MTDALQSAIPPPKGLLSPEFKYFTGGAAAVVPIVPGREVNVRTNGDASSIGPIARGAKNICSQSAICPGVIVVVNEGDMFGVPTPAPTDVTLGAVSAGRSPPRSGNVAFKLTDGTNVDAFPLTPNPSVSRLVIPGARKTVSSPAPGRPRLRFTVHRGAVGAPGFQ